VCVCEKRANHSHCCATLGAFHLSDTNRHKCHSVFLGSNE